jgi:hypothetical protein
LQSSSNSRNQKAKEEHSSRNSREQSSQSETRRFLKHAASKETSSISGRIRKESEQDIQGIGVDPNYQAKGFRKAAGPKNALKLKSRREAGLN